MKQRTPTEHPAITTVLVSRPGLMQQSLRSLLMACPSLAVISACGDGLNALGQVTQHQPRLLIIDANLLDEEVEALIMAVKAKQPAICCLALLYTKVREAQVLATGADAVMLRNSSAEEMQAILWAVAQKL